MLIVLGYSSYLCTAIASILLGSNLRLYCNFWRVARNLVAVLRERGLFAQNAND